MLTNCETDMIADDKDDIELAFIREFSCASNLIGKSKGKPERRERVRQAIYMSNRINEKFYNEPYNYAEAFRLCYGERLDRRAATRSLPDPDKNEDVGDT